MFSLVFQGLKVSSKFSELLFYFLFFISVFNVSSEFSISLFRLFRFIFFILLEHNVSTSVLTNISYYIQHFHFSIHLIMGNINRIFFFMAVMEYFFLCCFFYFFSESYRYLLPHRNALFFYRRTLFQIQGILPEYSEKYIYFLVLQNKFGFLLLYVVDFVGIIATPSASFALLKLRASPSASFASLKLRESEAFGDRRKARLKASGGFSAFVAGKLY